jgi:sulfite reductase (NADPH) flavoprotein alpha-component
MKPPITILFATMTGNAEGCAIDLELALKERGFTARKENLAHYDASSLARESIALLVVSTWGEGEPPDDAIPFYEDLQVLKAGSLSALRFAVFALGDSSYDEFCGFGRNCDQLLENAGATRLLPCEICDLDHDERLPRWACELADAIEANAAAVE